jgi:hypothetical protein
MAVRTSIGSKLSRGMVFAHSERFVSVLLSSERTTRAPFSSETNASIPFSLMNEQTVGGDGYIELAPPRGWEMPS